MPNGGHISCDNCTYSRFTPGKCDIFGIKSSPFIICRSFRMPKQSHSKARDRWPLLNQLEPGIVYSIDNDVLSQGDPQPIYKISKF